MSLSDDVREFGELQRDLLRPSFATPGARESWERSYPRLLEKYYESVAHYSQYRAECLRYGAGVASVEGVGRGCQKVSVACCDLESSGFAAERSAEVEEAGVGNGVGDCADGANQDGLRESDGGVRGKHWRRNQKKAQRRRENWRGRVNADAGFDLGSVSGSVSNFGINADAGSRKFGQSVGVLGKTPLRKSLEEKWQAENELKVAKAKRELELLKAEDLEAVKKLRERKVQGATERTMVQIEKAHASLVQTGNVPGVWPVQSGFCQTVVDGEVVESVPGLSSGESKECSISPSSSISEREVRNMMKELEDLREEVKRYRRKEGLGERVSRMYSESVPVTLDDEGCVPEDIKELAADRFEGHGFFKYGKVFEKDGKKYKTMKFDAEGYSYSGIENWYD